MTPIEVSWHDTDIAFVTLKGEHDLATQEWLAGTLRTVLRSGESLIVDLSEVEFIDSSVLNTLVAADQMARQRGGTLTLQLGTASVVRRILEVSGLLDHLPCADTRERAIRLARGLHASNGDAPV